MDFDKSKVYTVVNADELKIGSKVVVADTFCGLKERVEEDNVRTLTGVRDDDCLRRFEADSLDVYNLAYLVSEPEEKKLKWTDLKLGDVIRNKELPFIKYLITGIDEGAGQVFFCDSWAKSDELEEWEKIGQ